ncbi:hypothetical protein D3C81_2048200 [compost metagenome]
MEPAETHAIAANVACWPDAACMADARPQVPQEQAGKRFLIKLPSNGKRVEVIKCCADCK